MTRDRGHPPPDPTSWWQPSPSPSPPHAPHGSPAYGNGAVADLRERVRAIETTIPHLKEIALDRFSTQAKRMDGVDGRLEMGESRMDRLDERLSAAERAAAPLPAIETRVEAIERRWASWKAGLQYAVAALILGLVLARKMTLGEAAMLLKLIWPLSPG